jgi:hypothetical protein
MASDGHPRATERVGDVDAGKSLVHLQAERMAVTRYTELMASGGVGYNQIAKEVLFFLPKDFLDLYEELWHAGLAGKDDGGSGARGQSQHDTGVVGKAATRNVPGGMQISSGGAKRKSYKRYWVIADEEALALKDRVDKRLRGMAREVRIELGRIRSEREGRGQGDGAEQHGLVAGSTRGLRASCEECGRLAQGSWKFCPNCGSAMMRGDG